MTFSFSSLLSECRAECVEMQSEAFQCSSLIKMQKAEAKQAQ